jgi:hypothetical protein
MPNHYFWRKDLSKYTLKSFPSANEYVCDTNASDQLTYNANGTTLVVADTSSAQTFTNKTLTSPTINGTVTSSFTTISGDGAVTIQSGIVYLTKGSAAAISVAAPGASGIGVRITITSGSAFAHVITFTGGTLWDGTTGVNTTVTMTAYPGSTLTVIGTTATTWNLESQENLTSVA